MTSLSDAAVRQSIVERLSRLQAGSPRKWGRMSASEMICHLNDSFLVSLGQRQAAPRNNLFSRTVMRYIALRIPAPWPKGLPTMPEVRQGAGGTCPSEFHIDRDNLIATMRRFCLPDAEVGRHPHPLFGLMPQDDWMRWGYLHTDHHLRQFGL